MSAKTKTSKTKPSNKANSKNSTKQAQPKAARSKKTYPSFKESFLRSRERVWGKKRASKNPHRSFHCSYREDYQRGLQAPGYIAHASLSFKVILTNWRVFLPLIIMAFAINIFAVGLMSESNYASIQEGIEATYKNIDEDKPLPRIAKSGLLIVSTMATGGLNASTDNVQYLLAALLGLIIWLTTIYFLRHFLAGDKVKFRDGIYNAMTPFLSSLVTFGLILLHSLPLFIFAISYSAAVQTEFLSTPLYCFVFWVFSILLILLSCYLLSGSILALVATSVPGIYPMAAVSATADLVQGRRLEFVKRILFMILFLAVMWMLVLFPLTYLDLWLKDTILSGVQIPVIPIVLQFMTIFSGIYATTYIYLFYRRMLDDPE